MIIGGEGALVLGGLAAAAIGHLLAGAPPAGVKLPMALGAMLAGGAWIALAGALRQYRAVNETIASLLLTYIAIALFNHVVEGPLRDPANLNKPSTAPIGEASMVGNLPGLDVHWGLGLGVVFCLTMHALVRHTTHGFALRIAGGNARAARLAGLPVGGLVLAACALGGAAAGLAGILVMGAMSGYALSYATGNPWLGVLTAGVAGLVLGVLHALVCNLPRVNDIAVGIGLMLFGTGLAFFLGKPYVQPKAQTLCEAVITFSGLASKGDRLPWARVDTRPTGPQIFAGVDTVITREIEVIENQLRRNDVTMVQGEASFQALTHRRAVGMKPA